MGYYINPKDKSKEEFLSDYTLRGTLHVPSYPNNVPSFEELSKSGHLPVVLVCNELFTAAAIGYNKKEYEEIVDVIDKRPKIIFSVPFDDLVDVSDILQADKNRHNDIY
jgi:hypothetical protein